jgi:hypothetical protein
MRRLARAGISTRGELTARTVHPELAEAPAMAEKPDRSATRAMMVKSAVDRFDG